MNQTKLDGLAQVRMIRLLLRRSSQESISKCYSVCCSVREQCKFNHSHHILHTLDLRIFEGTWHEENLNM